MHARRTPPQTVSVQASVQTLRNALDTLGSVDQLARKLRVPAAQTRRWLAGDEVAPLEMFLQALDLVAAGPYQVYLPERRKRRKVAVLNPYARNPLGAS